MSSVRRSKKPHANVVARLMGFEGLPNQQTVCMSCKDNMRHMKGDDACKDVYIVHETVKVGKVRCGSEEYSGSERSYDGETSLNGECRVIDRKRNHMVKIGDLPFVADSNKEVFIEFLQNPTPLMSKHMDGFRSYDTKDRGFCNTVKNVKRVSSWDLMDERRNLTTWSTGTGNKRDFSGCSKSWSGNEYEMLALPARIVVLDPNSSRSMSNKRHIGEYVRPLRTYFAPDPDYETKSRWKIDCHRVDLPLRKGKNCEGPRKNSRKKIHGLRMAALGFIPKKFTGYAGDESSFYSSDDELKDMLTSRNIVYSSRWSSSSQSVHAPLSEQRETSGKWKKTGSCKTIRLGVMQSVTDKEDRVRTANSRIGQGTNINGLEATGGCKCPLRICKMKDEYSRDSSRHVSPRGQPAVFRICKGSVPHKMVKEDSSMWTSETSGLCRNPTKVYMSENETSSFRNENLSGNSHIRKSSNRENGDYSNEGFVYHSQQISTFLNKYRANVRSSILHRLNECDHSWKAESLTPPERVLNKDAKPCHQNMLNSQEEFIQRTEDVSTPTKNEVFGSISPLSSEEAKQPIPVSVLDSKVDASSSGSEYLERIFADIQGLRARLKMLKLELAAEDKPKFTQTITQKDQDIEKDEVSGSVVKGLLLDQILDSSYLADVLVECGFEDEDPSSILWVLPNVPPMELSMFETLEKKHSENATWPRSERRLLFDQINSGLMEIFNQHPDPCLWGKSITKKVVPFIKNALKEDLCKLLARQEQKAGCEKVQGAVPLLMFELWENIREIGREVVETLVDELVEEVFREGL